MGSCTDPTFTDRKCPQHCTEYPTQGVIYNSTSGLWACCYGSGVLDCRYPSNETFFAPGPEKLFPSIPPTASSVSSTSPTSPIHTTSHTSSGTSSTSNLTGTHYDTHGLSQTATIALTTVFSIIGFIVVVVLSVWFCWRKKRNNQLRPRINSRPEERDSNTMVISRPIRPIRHEETASFQAQPEPVSGLGEVGVERERAVLPSLSSRPNPSSDVLPREWRSMDTSWSLDGFESFENRLTV